MSHSISMTVALNTSHEIKVCDSIENEINLFSSEYKDLFSKEILDIQDNIKKLKEFASSINNVIGDSDSIAQTKTFFEYQKLQDSITKKIKNIKSINIGTYVERVQGIQKDEIDKIVTKNGILAILAMQSLETKAIELNSINLENAISEIRNKSLEESQLNIEVKSLENNIYDQEVNEALEEHLLDLIDEVKSAQEIADIYALIGHMQLEEKRINEMFIDVTKILKTIGFEYQKEVVNVNSEGTIIKTVSYRNSLNKEFKVKYRATGIDYKMGNYEKHLCESDSEKFMDIFTKQFRVSDIRIKRNISNARPVLKEMKMKERKI